MAGTGTGATTSTATASISSSKSSKSSKTFHIERVKEFSDLFSEGYYLSPSTTIFSAASNANLPRPLHNQPTLDGKNMICLPGSSTGLHQYIGKSNLKLKKISPAFLYLQYYAHTTEGNGNGNGGSRRNRAKHVYVRPALSPDDEERKSKYLPVADAGDFEWREAIVKLDIDIASKKSSQFPGFEIGALNFEDGDLFVINRFVLMQGVELESPGFERLRAEFEADSGIPGPVLPVQSLVMARVERELQENGDLSSDNSNDMGWMSAVVLRPLFWCWACCFTSNHNSYGRIP